MNATEELRTVIESTVSDLAVTFVLDDRREDEELPRGSIEDALDAGIVTIEEMVVWFRASLTDMLT